MSTKLKGTITKIANGVATITVVRTKRHPLYGKMYKVSKKFHAKANEGINIGDEVVISETKPLSKIIHWQINKAEK